MTTLQIRERTEIMGRAAAFMKSVGFDAIEIQKLNQLGAQAGVTEALVVPTLLCAIRDADLACEN